MTDKPASLPGEFLFRIQGDAAVGERLQVTGPMGGRYFSTSSEGGVVEGPRIRGRMLKGFAWSPHRMRESNFGHLHYDVRVLLLTDDGHRIRMIYRGTNSPTYADGSWRTGAVFEAENGPYGWLNAEVAVGYGRKVGDAVEYMMYALRS